MVSQFKLLSEGNVCLPMIASLYSQEFSPSIDEKSSKVNIIKDILKELLPYLRPEDSGVVTKLLALEQVNFTATYTPLDYKCRLLRRQLP